MEGFAVTARPSLPNPTPRCGRRSGLVRQGGDGLSVAYTGSRLTTSVGYRGDKPLRHPTLATYNPHGFGFCWSLPLRTAPHSDIESACACGFGSLSTALQERIRLAPLQSGIGSTSCADTRLTVTMQAQCSVFVCPATPNGSPAHTQCTNRLVASLPLFATQCSCCARRLSVG